MRIEQQNKEVEDLKLFFQLLGEENFKFTKNEAPDFDVLISGASVGIELTNYKFSKKHSNLILSVKSTMESIIETVEEKINSHSNKILINYTLRKPITRKIKKADKLEIIDFLTNHINKSEVQNEMNKPFFRFEYKYSKIQNEFIKKVNISSNERFKKSRVTNNNSYMVGVVSREKILDIVYEKHFKMDYNKNNKNWLVIIFEQNEHSDGIIDDSVLNYDLTEFGFDRIFLVEKLMNKIHEMKKCV